MTASRNLSRLRTDGPPLLAYSVDNIMTMVGIGRATVYRMIRAGDLPAKKLGGRTVVLASDLEAWLKALPVMDRS